MMNQPRQTNCSTCATGKASCTSPVTGVPLCIGCAAPTTRIAPSSLTFRRKRR